VCGPFYLLSPRVEIIWKRSLLSIVILCISWGFFWLWWSAEVLSANARFVNIDFHTALLFYELLSKIDAYAITYAKPGFLHKINSSDNPWKCINIFSTLNRFYQQLCLKNLLNALQCLKIPKKVSFNIASEASYLYILSGQKLVKNAKNSPFWRVFENLKLEVKQCYQTSHF